MTTKTTTIQERVLNALTEGKALTSADIKNRFGAGNPQARFPKLSGQHADYTVAQLKSFAKGERANDAGSMMRVVAGKMSEAEMNAVAQYIQGLR